MILLLQHNAFRTVTQLISLGLVAVLVFLWTVTWPLFELNDWVTREVTKRRATPLKTVLLRKKIGFGPRIVAATLLFIAAVWQRRQFDRILRARTSRRNFDDLAGDAGVSVEPSSSAVERPKLLDPMIVKMTAGQRGLI